MIAIDLRGENPLSGTPLWRLNECKRVADALADMSIDTTDDYRRAVAIEAFINDTLRSDAEGMSAPDRNTVAKAQSGITGHICAHNDRFILRDPTTYQLARFLIGTRAAKQDMKVLHPLICEARDLGVLRYQRDPLSGEVKLYVVGTHEYIAGDLATAAGPLACKWTRPNARYAVEVTAVHCADVPRSQLEAWLHRMPMLGPDYDKRRVGDQPGEVFKSRALLSKRIKPLLDGRYSRLAPDTLVDAPDPWQVPVATPDKAGRKSIEDVDALPLDEWQVHFVSCPLPEDFRKRMERVGVKVRTQPVRGLTHLVTFDPPVAPGQPYDDSMTYEDFLKYVAARRKLEPVGTKFLSWVDFRHLLDAREKAFLDEHYNVRSPLGPIFVGI